jgi:hypothetical protein
VQSKMRIIALSGLILCALIARVAAAASTSPDAAMGSAKSMALEVAGVPVPPVDECGEVDFGIDPNSPCAGVFSAEPEKSPEEQWHQEEAERVDAVINKTLPQRA